MQPAIILSDQDSRHDLEASITNLRAALASTGDPERRERYTAAIDEALELWSRAE